MDCLKTIGSQEALRVVREYAEQKKDAYAREIVAEQSPELMPEAPVYTPQRLFIDLPPTFRNPFEYNLEYILIRGGTFTYSVTDKAETVPDIYFAKYPVTNQRYRRFVRYLRKEEQELVGLLPHDKYQGHLLDLASQIKGFSDYLGPDKELIVKFRSDFDDEKRFNSDDQPVVGISWYDARAYCLWMSLLEAAQAGIDADDETIMNLYRLANEIEWEWAAVGEGKREYPWGKTEPNDKLANYASNVGATTPVGRYPDGATPEGLMDMAGNVWEWMANRHEKYQEACSLRGGSLLSVESFLRSSARSYDPPYFRCDFIGFRVVRSQSCPGDLIL